MDHFMWFALTVLLSNSVLGTPTPEDPPFYSDFLSENDFAENTLAFNDVETSSLIPLDFATQNLDFMDPTLLQPLEDPWLADDPASFPDDTRLLADSTDTFSETAPFFESSDPPSAKSCKIADRDDFKLYFKRNDGGICTTPTAETDPLPLLKLPDLDTLRKVLGSDQEEPTKRPANIIPPIPGYTPDDDNMCPRPWRRLCCQGPVYNAFSKSLLLVSDCRDFGPWRCAARYDVCCQGWVNFEFPTLKLGATGYKCLVLSENPNAVGWESDPGQAPPL